jgi:serine/threonine-protein kinase PknG
VRAARKDVPGSLAALALVPSTSRGYPESQRMRARQLTATAADPAGIEAAFSALVEARLDEATATACRTVLYRRAAAVIGEGRAVTESGQQLTPTLVAERLADCYRHLGRLADDPGLRAGYVDLANELRPWSLI